MDTVVVHHITGLYLPTSGTCTTLGKNSGELGPQQLSAIGVVNQDSRLFEWMKVGQHLRYIASSGNNSYQSEFEYAA